MKKKDILHNCATIYTALDDLEDNRLGFNFRDFGKIRTFAFVLIDEDKRVKSTFKENYSDIEDELTQLECDLFEVGFSLGYVIGQSFDIPYPEVRRAIESIKTVIKEKALLPYLPRERRETNE